MTCDDPSLHKEENKRRKVTYRNPSTKIRALVQDMLANREMGDEKGRIKRYDNEITQFYALVLTQFLSVVFSGWTMHLDLIEVAFASEGITWKRIDGKMNRAQRTESLTAFREDPNIEAILVSINAGGLG